jgi:hypothetical protein
MSKSRRMIWVGHVVHMEMRNAFKILVGMSEGRRPLGRRRRRCEDDIKMDIRGKRFEDVDRIHLAQDRDQCRAVVNTVMNLRVSYTVGNLWAS